MKTRFPVLGILCFVGIAGCAYFPSLHPNHGNQAFQSFDTDHDGTLSLKEAHATAIQKFNSNHAKDTMAKRATSRSAYLNSVDRMFARADVDHDGTLDADELASPAGQQLLLLIQE